VDLSEVDAVVVEPNAGDAFALAPASASIQPAQAFCAISRISASTARVSL
jgi:hypothetical protein